MHAPAASALGAVLSTIDLGPTQRLQRLPDVLYLRIDVVSRLKRAAQGAGRGERLLRLERCIAAGRHGQHKTNGSPKSTLAYNRFSVFSFSILHQTEKRNLSG